MLIDRESALAVAEPLVKAWNERRESRLLDLLRDDIVFRSPLLHQLYHIQEGEIRGKKDLAPYLGRILMELPHTKFSIKNIFLGMNGFVLEFVSIFEKTVIGVFDLDDQGRISGWSAYFDSLDLP